MNPSGKTSKIPSIPTHAYKKVIIFLPSGHFCLSLGTLARSCDEHISKRIGNFSPCRRLKNFRLCRHPDLEPLLHELDQYRGHTLVGSPDCETDHLQCRISISLARMINLGDIPEFHNWAPTSTDNQTCLRRQCATHLLQQNSSYWDQHHPECPI